MSFQEFHLNLSWWCWKRFRKLLMCSKGTAWFITAWLWTRASGKASTSPQFLLPAGRQLFHVFFFALSCGLASTVMCPLIPLHKQFLTPVGETSGCFFLYTYLMTSCLCVWFDAQASSNRAAGCVFLSQIRKSVGRLTWWEQGGFSDPNETETRNWNMYADIKCTFYSCHSKIKTSGSFFMWCLCVCVRTSHHQTDPPPVKQTELMEDLAGLALSAGTHFLLLILSQPPHGTRV